MGAQRGEVLSLRSSARDVAEAAAVVGNFDTTVHALSHNRSAFSRPDATRLLRQALFTQPPGYSTTPPTDTPPVSDVYLGKTS
ncbi:MAG TPA: hypothetical protein VEW42_00935 [Candidatus Eisenbacteria bacterium]|nr:hypothetical protein [Candidatus Eisenbacteria bacterium]